MPYRTLIFIVLYIFPAMHVTGSSPVSILVRDKEKKSVPGATVQLFNHNTGKTEATITDISGVARFGSIDPNIYSVIIRSVGFRTIEESISVNRDITHFEFFLQEDLVSLDEVTVTARRPIIRQEDDKMIIDPEPMANSSTNTLEVLEQTPGLFVDQDGGIFLNNARPATVYINGREQKMSSQDITGILRSLPPGSVQRIEVMRTPSTKYDASSSGGIINIVLKRGVKIGRFGTVNAGMNQGYYGNRFAGISFNNSGDKSTRYINGNFNHSGQSEEISGTRNLNQNQNLTQSARTRSFSDQGYLGYGINYEYNDRLNLSYDGRINASARDATTNNRNMISLNTSGVDSEHQTTTSNQTNFISLQQDFGAVRRLDTLGSVWDNKFSFSYNNGQTSQKYTNQLNQEPNPYPGGSGTVDQRRFFTQLQSDVNWQIPDRWRFEAGVKGTLQQFTGESDFVAIRLNGPEPDLLKNSTYRSNEIISAAYVQASKNLPGELLLKMGTRLEYTHLSGKQVIPSDTSFSISRFDLFPYVYLSRSLISIMTYELRGFLIYRRTIGRPGYENLNPSIRFVDLYTYETGNPSLKPQFTDTWEANISFDDIPVFAVGVNKTNDIISSVIYRHPDKELLDVRTFDNVGKSRETYFRLTGAIPPSGKYFFVAGAQYNLNTYDGLYQNEPLSFSRGSWRFFTYHSLNLARNTRLTMNGFLMHKGVMNFYELDTFGQLNFNLNQSLLNKKLLVSLSARDVLNSMTNHFEFNQGGIYTFGKRKTDTRRFGINIRYTFGVQDKKEKNGLKNFNFDDQS